MECALTMLADDIKFGGNGLYIWVQGYHLEGPRQIGERDQQESVNSTRTSAKLFFSIWKEWPLSPVQVGTGWLGSISAEKDLWVWMDKKVNVRQKSALIPKKFNSILGYIWRNMDSRLWEVIIPLYLALASKIASSIWCHQCIKHINKLEQFQCIVPGMVRSFEQVPEKTEPSSLQWCMAGGWTRADKREVQTGVVGWS